METRNANTGRQHADAHSGQHPGDGERRDETALWLRDGDQRILGIMLSVALMLMGWHWARLSDWGRESVEVRRFEPKRTDYRIDINRADWVQWAQLEGIGPALSRRIVADRQQNGPFPSVNALQRIKGIGPRILERIRPHLECSAGVPPSGAASTGTAVRR